MTGIKVKIIGIEADSGYEDVVYTQYVIVMLPDGKKMFLFDPVEMKASEDMIGQTKVVTMFIPFGKVEIIGKTTLRVEPSIDHPKIVIFYGMVESKILMIPGAHHPISIVT